MNHNEAGEILRASVAGLSEPLKSAIEFTLTNFYTTKPVTETIKFLVAHFQMLTPEFQKAVKAVIKRIRMYPISNGQLNLKIYFTRIPNRLKKVNSGF